MKEFSKSPKIVVRQSDMDKKTIYELVDLRTKDGHL